VIAAVVAAVAGATSRENAAVGTGEGLTASPAGLEGPASHAPGAVSLLAVDMDTRGNRIGAAIDTTDDTVPDREQTSLGPIDKCAEIATGETLDIDIVVADWPANGDQLIGYDIILNYDSSVVFVKAANLGIAPGTLPLTLISADPQSSAFGSFASLSDATPDRDGSFALAVIDLAGPFGDAAAEGGNGNLIIDGREEDSDGEETSPGFLARVTLEALAPGQSTLSLSTDSNFILAELALGSFVPVAQLNNGFISVDQACKPGPQPSPLPETGGTTPGPGSPSPGGGTPTGDGEPSDSQTPSASPSEGTIVTGGTPVNETNADGKDGGNGLGTGVWIAIVGVAAAAVAGGIALGRWLLIRRTSPPGSE